MVDHVNGGKLGREHHFNLVFRLDTLDHGEHEVQFHQLIDLQVM